ncbi:MAG: hypothetical protein FWD27_00565 [Coriobacteriia bacterium]|nr:hypothetical protein [Coriobacteriia bacterium]
MSITKELREWGWCNLDVIDNRKSSLVAIADRIDEAHTNMGDNIAELAKENVILCEDAMKYRNKALKYCCYQRKCNFRDICEHPDGEWCEDVVKEVDSDV